MISVFSWQNSVSLCPPSFCTQRSNLPVTPGKSLFFFFFFLNFILFFKLYITVLDLPNIKMNPPQVYMCSELPIFEF